jgi:hypothetical protein
MLIFLGPACSIMLTIGLLWAGVWLLLPQQSFSGRKNRLHFLLPRVASNFVHEWSGLPSVMLVGLGSLVLPWYGLLGIRAGDLLLALGAAVVTITLLMVSVFVLMIGVSEKYVPLWMRIVIPCLFVFGAIVYEHYGPKDPFGISARLEKHVTHVPIKHH